MDDEVIKDFKPSVVVSLDDLDLSPDCPKGMISDREFQRIAAKHGLKDTRVKMSQLSPEAIAAAEASAKAWSDRWDKQRAEIEAQAEQSRKAFRKAMGRGGMRAGDYLDETFIPYPVERWTLKELKNRIAWLKRQRGRLLGKPGQEGALAQNHAKLSRYTTELFKRYSVEGQKKTRDEFNRLRRSRRKIAKQRKIAALMRTWKEKKLVERLAAKVVKILEG